VVWAATRGGLVGKEIERKYLVDVALWKPRGEGVHFTQGYLSADEARLVRVRIEGSVAKLTIKGALRGVTRAEFEYSIPIDDAAVLLADLCEKPLIEKRRHKETQGGKTWEIDVFLGENQGLVVAEVELASEDETVAIPNWAVHEVSGDARYYNANLLKMPYTKWPKPGVPGPLSG
jgi:adenylate cyclase